MDWPRETDVSWVQEIKKKLEIQNAYRGRIQSATHFDEAKLRSLDSAFKKTTAFMRKVKALTASTVPSTIPELSTLNLSKFIEEIAQAIAETKMKAADIASIVDFCVEITLRYSNFPENLLEQLKKSLPLKKIDKVTNPAKLRIDLRFLCELVICGVLGKEGLQCIGAVINFLTSTDKNEFVHVGLICSLCRPVGWQIAGITPLPDPKQEQKMSITEGCISPGPIIATHKTAMFNLLSEYNNVLVQKVDKACAAMNSIQKKVKRQERTRGDASAEEKSALEAAKSEFESFRTLAADLSNSLGLILKTFKEEPSDDEEDELAAAEMDKALHEGQVVLWPDEETKAFYTNLLDIRAMLPKNYYKESEERTLESSEMKTSVDEVNLEGIEVEQESTSIEHPSVLREQTASPVLDAEQIQEILAPLTEDMKVHMQKFIGQLDHLVNRQVTDEAALDFVTHLNTKSNRKRLVKLLGGCPSSRMDIVPFYARLVATLAPVMPDVTVEITDSLIKTFRKYVANRSNEDRIESKLVCAMYISELVKFGIIPRAEALSCLRQLVYDFRWHFIDMACMMMETAGYYLYRNPDSHPKMIIILDVVLKKRERIKDMRHTMLIDNAFYACIPAKNGLNRRVKEEAVMNQFVRSIIQRVTEESVDQRIKWLRRLEWTDEQISNFCLRLLSSPWLVPYSNLPALASTIAGLRNLSYHDWIGIWIIDSLVETIRLSLEIPGLYNQQAIACVTLLGELYNYNVCDSIIIYKILYQLISFPENDIDAWQDFYRIRMACELMNTVGEFFQTGNAAKKMDYYLVYFRRYYWHKKEQWTANSEQEGNTNFTFPADIESEYKGCMKKIRKSAKLPKNLDECEKAVADVEKDIKTQALVPDENDEDEEPRHLTRIVEEEEDDEDSSFETKNKSYATVVCSYDDQDEKVHVRMEPSEKTAEDEEFEREFDRLMTESLRITALSSTQAMDMSVPAGFQQKYTRTITFDDEEREEFEEPKPLNKVALMTRGKGNKPVLKTVSIEEQSLHESWQKEKEREEKERAINKRVTLGHTARMEAEEEQEKKISFVGKRIVHKFR